MLAPLTAQQTLDRAHALMKSGRGVALPELLKLIETLSLNICEVTVSDLAELIEKDAVILAKIISVANTLSHNPGISPLATLSQAIHQIGYNRIRTIAVSLLLLDAAGGDANPVEQREAATRALGAGLLAQGAAEWLGTHDPEFVFACATLRNFGFIMFAAVSAAHSQAAAQRRLTIPEAAAYRAEFGITPLDFSRRLLSAVRLPEEVLATLRDCEPESLAGIATTYDARLLGLVDFGSRLSNLVLDARHGPDAFVREMRTLSRRFDQVVPGAADLIKPTLQRADERLRSFTRCHGGRPLPTASLNRMRWRLEHIAPAKIPPAPLIEPGLSSPSTPVSLASANGASPSASAIDTTSVHSPTAAESPWDASLAKQVSFESQPVTAPSTDPVQNALALVCATLGAQECWLFTGETTQALTLTAGVGPGYAAQSNPAEIHADERSVFGVALSRHEIVLIHDSSDPGIVPYLPAWFSQRESAPAAFALVPFASAEATPGLILIGWAVARRVTLSVAELTLINQLLASAVTATPVTTS